MSIISKQYTFSAGATIVAAQFNSNFDTIYNDYNGNITDANISASAAISNSKINLSAITQSVALSGGLTMTGTQIDEAKGAGVASAGTTNVWITDGNYLHVTGNTGPITSLGTAAQAGATRTVVFDSTPTLTHNATSLILPTGANIVAAAGDVAIVRAETTANARVIGYFRADGTALVAATASNALAGSVIQTKNVITGALVNAGTGTYTINDTAPTTSNGNAVAALDLAITPNNASNMLQINVIVQMSHSGSGQLVLALHQDANANAIRTAIMRSETVDKIYELTLTHYVAAGTTSATTFKVRIGCDNAGTSYLNGISNVRVFGGTLSSAMTIKEIKV